MGVKKSWWILLIVSLGVIIPFLAPYLTLNPENSRVPIAIGGLQFPILVAHIGFALVALLTGFLQFVDRIRLKKPYLHRNLGKAYVISVFVSGLLALLLVFFIEDFSKSMSFLALSLVWMFTCWKGFRAAITKKFDNHRKWMIRSFGITLVAVSGRVIVPLLLLAYLTLHGFTLPGGRELMVEEVLNVNIWVGLLLNFIIVEWVILKRSTSKE